MRPLLAATFAACLACAGQAQALNILLTNDDGYDHPNIRALYQNLRAAGHTVRIAAPWQEQSARGGAFFYGREVFAGRDADPAYPDSYYLKTHERVACLSPVCAGREIDAEISATPLMALLYGLSKVLPEADLVISGPNVGHNLGALNAISGTYNAAFGAVQAGVPALAVSADLKEAEPARIAAIVGRLVQALEQQRQPGQALLPKGVGLNLNIPRSDALKGFRITRIGSYAPFLPVYSDDLAPLFPAAAGKPGISFAYTDGPEAGDEDSEALWVARGYITLSPFQGVAQAPRDLRLPLLREP